MMLLIGSAAAHHWLPSSYRIPRDYDFITTYDDFEAWKKKEKNNIKYLMPANKGKKMIAKDGIDIFEFEIAWPGSTAEKLLNLLNIEEEVKQLQLVSRDTNIHHDCQIASLQLLYTIKMSHRYLRNSPHFLKTMNDIHHLRQYFDIKDNIIPPLLKDWFKERERETYDYGHPKLNQNKDGFFDKNQGVVYTYDHDSIHQAMAQMEKPAYTYYKSDYAEVMCDKNKFFNLSESIRLNGVLEESLTLAAERSQIPFKGKIDPYVSFTMALEKVCTSITSGWFREFAWENYYKVLALYPPDYMDKFWKAAEQGIVKKI